MKPAWKTIETNQKQWKTMKPPWKTMETNQKPWNHLEKTWKPTKNHEKPWSHLEKPTGGPTDLYWSKNVTVTNTGSNWPPLIQKRYRYQHAVPTDLHWSKNVTVTNTGPNRPFRCLDSQTNLFSVKKLTSTVFLSFRVSSSTIGTFNPKEFKIICQKRKNISRKGSTFRCNVSHLNFKQIGGEETNCLKQAFWAFLPPTSSRGTCRFSHYLFININIIF